MDIITKSGAKVVINVAPFDAAKMLWAAVEKIGADKNIAIDGSIINLVMAVDSSPDFNAALWPCLIRCTYNDKKIEKSVFEDVEVRKEYYEIIAQCVEINIRPFAESLSSELSVRLAAMAMQKQKDNPV